MLKPLQPGDCIGIAAPASPFDKKQFQDGVSILKKMGFEVYYQTDIFSSEGYLAGSDRRRADELTGLFTDKRIKAILFARGGYGSQRMIPFLKPGILKKNPKPVVGFSDITPLLTYLRQTAKVPTFYGPVVTQLGKTPTQRTLASLEKALKGDLPPVIDLAPCRILKTGSAEGFLTGGCLTLINTSIATPYELKTDKAILFFEDTGEKTYAIDRMLTQLKNAGKLKPVLGIIIGSLKPKESESREMESMLKDIFSDFKGPIAANFPAGHTDDFVTLPLGAKVRLDTQARRLTFKSYE